MRVAGSEPLKIITPSKPLSHPESAPGSALCASALTILTPPSISLSHEWRDVSLPNPLQSKNCHRYIS